MSRNCCSSECPTCGIELDPKNIVSRPLTFLEYLKITKNKYVESHYFNEFKYLLIGMYICQCGEILAIWINGETNIYMDHSYFFSFNDEP